MTNRHDVELTYLDGKRELLIDGEKVRGVVNTTVEVGVHAIPKVTIEMLPRSVRYLGDGDTALEEVQPLVEEEHDGRHTAVCACSDGRGRGKFDQSTGLHEWYEDGRSSGPGTITARLVLDTTDFDAAVARVQDSLEALASTPIRVRIES